MIAANLDDLFPGMEIVHHSLFRVTRDTDYDVSDEADDLLLAVEEEVRRRRFGEVVRLEVAPRWSRGFATGWSRRWRSRRTRSTSSTGCSGWMTSATSTRCQGFRELRYPPWKGVTPPQLQQGSRTQREVDVFAAMRQGDILVHHPYDSFAGSVERFVRQAVEDPNVLAIKQTVYRTSADSPLVPALIEASERGKQAVCLVELKARFDESANIRWARALEEAGVHVVYGIPGLKTHVKCVLVARREGEGVRNYVHIGTGNYNPKTARIYTDFGLFTANPEIGDDIAEMFNYLTGYARPSGYRKVLVAPFNLKEGIIGEIERTIEAHSPERPARIRMKMNSLLDPPCIRALYRASQAGVEVELNIRGICALRPGVQGVSENIRVVSVVGRFLEHSRIYSFERPEEDPHLHRLRRPDAAKPLQPGRAGHAGRGPKPTASSSPTCSTAPSPTTPTPGSSGRTASGRGGRSNGDPPRSLQAELIELHTRARRSGRQNRCVSADSARGNAC